MKSRYQTLGPLLKSINNASTEFKQCELDVKRLLDDLKAARMKLVTAEQNIQIYIKKLVNEKDALDSMSVSPGIIFCKLILFILVWKALLHIKHKMLRSK